MSAEERPVRCNRSRIKWTEEMNNILWDCKSKAQALIKSENPPRLENGRKKGYMCVMKELWDEAGFNQPELAGPSVEIRKVYWRCRTCDRGECRVKSWV